MNNEIGIEKLYKEIFGNLKSELDYSNVSCAKFPIKQHNNKCNDCSSNEFKQDLPYFKNINNIVDFVIAEAPGKGNSNSDLGSVFGWEEWRDEKISLKLKYYKNYFFNILNLKPDETYITDAVKCYTAKNDFNKAFEECKKYLIQEIRLLNPKRIIIISKQKELEMEIRTHFDESKYEILVIPHPSNQNTSKIPTVAEIFIKLGSINKNNNWIKLGEKIEKEYEKLRKELNK